MKEINELNWEAAAEIWKKADAALQAAKKAEDDARQTLIEMAPAGHKGAGIELVRVISEGRVAYKAVLDELLPGIDTSKWRGEPSTTYRILKDKEKK